MNKYQEAFANVKRACMVPFLGRKPIDVCGVSLDRLKELVERATPKKPIKTRVSYDVGYDDVATADAYDCPTCNKRIADDYMDMNRYNYCPHCQQAIDWSDEE